MHFPTENTVFHFEVIRRQAEKLSKIESRIFMFLGSRFFGSGPQLLSQFLKLHLLLNTWECFVAIGRNTSKITRPKRRKKHQEQNTMAYAYYRQGGHKMAWNMRAFG